MRPSVIVASLAVVGFLAVGVGAAVSGVASTPPLADAGLDQSVSVGETVRLDGTGSRDPDGRITNYRWRIEAPDGSTTTPVCETCGRTRFRPTQRGQYDVTVTVTDNTGATRQDTLYVNVSAGPGPTVSVSGPDDPRTGQSVTYTASASGGNVDLSRAVWSVDGSVVQRDPLSGPSATATLDRSFDDTDEHTVTVEVIDVAEQRAETEQSVSPQQPPNRGGGNGGGDQPSGYYFHGGTGGDGTWVPSTDSGGPAPASTYQGAVQRAITIVGNGPGTNAGIDRQENSDNSDERNQRRDFD